ncbi:MAG: small multi-drug export protein [Desulfurococcaceae archaeon]
MDPLRLILLSFLLGVAPVSEIRGAIPFAAVSSSSPVEMALGMAAGVAGNLLAPFAAFLVLKALDAIARWRRTPRAVAGLYEKIISYGRRKASSIRGKRAVYAALAVFVAVPLPATGAWTGALIAFVLGLDFRRSVLAIEAGVLGASGIVAAAVLGAYWLKAIFAL